MDTLGGDNDSTDGIAGADPGDRDELNDAGIFQPNIIVDTLDNQVPDEYKDDPDLWYAMQASLKVIIHTKI